MNVTAYNNSLALAVRRVNATWAQCGKPAVPALQPLWLNLNRGLHLAAVEGDDARAVRLIRRWRDSAVAAIETEAVR